MSGRLAGLYVHVPFCDRICPYCDFAVRTGDAARRRRYVDHLLREIELWSDTPMRFDTVYFGGGTPSCLDAEDLGRILAAVGERFDLDAPRIFLEANPEHADAATVAAWRRLGVDTVSLGVQALDAEALRFLGRTHDVAQARRSVALCREAGLRTVSIDLIYGLPGQTADGWREEIDRALALEPDHVSCYQLTIHPRTRFALLEKRGKLVQLPGDGQAELFRLAHRHFAAAGMAGYEVSQFATGPEHRSSHNVKYWDHTPYLGLGPSAHSFDGACRWWNLRKTDLWQERVAAGERPVEASEALDGRALALETLMTGLRTYRGVDAADVRRRCGIDLLAANEELLQRLEADGLLTVDGTRLVPTLDGLAVADGLAASFRIGDVSQTPESGTP